MDSNPQQSIGVTQEIWTAIFRATSEREELQRELRRLQVRVAQLEASKGREGYPFAPYTEWYPVVGPTCGAATGRPPVQNLATTTSNTGQTVYIPN